MTLGTVSAHDGLLSVVPAPLAQHLRDAGTRALARYMADQVGDTAAVLIERDGQGLSEHYAPVHIATDTVPGEIVPVALTGTTGSHLVGTPFS